MTRKQRRLMLISVAGATLAVAVALILVALEDQVVFFRSPSDLAAAAAAATGERVRIGGLVVAGSLEKSAGTEVVFAVTDTASTIKVRYGGILPDLFREGQGVVAEGIVDGSGWLIADTVLARHDETYMPSEVVESLKRQGMWKDGRMVDGADATGASGSHDEGASAPSGGPSETN